jgi:NADP-dependent 3-hydroxy acid dehydrogenase YdfG
MINQNTIFITGAASGIGRATALHFAGQGWFVGICDLNEKGLHSLQAEIGTCNCSVSVMDVSDSENVRQAVESFVKATGGRIDVLFNNAGILRMGLNETIAIHDQRQMVEVNFIGILNCIHHALPYLKKTSKSKIINMASASALYGTPELAVYSATKHAVRALTEALNIEMEAQGITVCDIIAPYVRTPLLDAPVQAYSIDKLGIHLEPSDVAAIVWRAAHKNKVHWIMTALFKFLAFSIGIGMGIAPFANRSITKMLCMSPKRVPSRR